METDLWIEREMPNGSYRRFTIDTKYYREALRGGKKFKREDLFQLYSYMSNAKLAHADTTESMHGCLLYPLNGRSLQEDVKLPVGTLHVRTVDLDADWPDIESQMRQLFDSMDY